MMDAQMQQFLLWNTSARSSWCACTWHSIRKQIESQVNARRTWRAEKLLTISLCACNYYSCYHYSSTRLFCIVYVQSYSREMSALSHARQGRMGKTPNDTKQEQLAARGTEPHKHEHVSYSLWCWAPPATRSTYCLDFFFSLSPCRRWARLKRPVIAWLQGGARKDLLPLDLSSFPPPRKPL